MQVVAYKALDGKLFEYEAQQQEYDRQHLRKKMMADLANSALVFNAGSEFDETSMSHALEFLFTSYGEEVVKAVQAYRKQSQS